MKIIADENIALVSEYFGNDGELTLMPGRSINAEVVKDADVLLVRSVTRVDEHLLRNSQCKFVGTATSGIDHIDTQWLTANEIGLGWARGCNAESVVDYIFSVLASLSEKKGFDWRRLSFGLVGCGEVGRRLAIKLLGLQCRINVHDPFLDAEQHPLAPYFTSYRNVIQQEIVTFHTPITTSPPWPTWHLMGEDALNALLPNSILINAARGAVIDNEAILTRLKSNPEQQVVLDAWEGEPDINLDLLKRVTIATPHIAGYSREGKLNGTRMVYAQYAEFFGLQKSEKPDVLLQKKIRLEIDKNLQPLAQLNQLIRKAYDVMKDHADMQKLLDATNAGVGFDTLRKTYPVRHEFRAFSIKAEDLTESIQDQARILGFTLIS